jgi:hypothetical protein
MIVGGALRGFRRSLRISLRYLRAYFYLGCPLLLLLIAVLSGYHDPVAEGIQFLFYFALVCIMLVFPPAVFANLLFVRLFQRRTWRNEPWRAWVAGARGLLISWGGMFLLGNRLGRPPELLRELLGGAAEFFHILGWFVLLSNLGLFLAWLIPSRRSPGTVKQ